MKILLISIALITSLVCHAQQDPIYSQYMFNLVNINPGYVGSRNVLSLVALHRAQWVNVEGAPSTTSLTADMPILNNKIGVGFSFVHDEIGRFSNNLFKAFAAYRLQTDRKGTLALGLSGGLSRVHADLSSIRTNPQGTSENLFQDYNEVSPALGAGLFYNRDRWYLGLSAPTILNNYDREFSNEPNVLNRFQHLYFMGGYVFGLSKAVVLKPSFMLRSAIGAPISFDLNTNLWLHDVLGLGVSYRINNAVIGLLEIQATPQFRVGYAIDYTTSDFENSKGNKPLTHEFLLRYEFGFQQEKVLSPRYF